MLDLGIHFLLNESILNIVNNGYDRCILGYELNMIIYHI